MPADALDSFKPDWKAGLTLPNGAASVQLQRGLHQEGGPLPQQEDLPGEHQEAAGPERSAEELHRRPQEEGETAGTALDVC